MKADFNSIRESLNSHDWGALFLTDNIDYKVATFYSVLDDLIERFVSQCKLSNNNSSYPPWDTRPLIKLSNEKRKYHKKWKIDGLKHDYSIFSLLRSRHNKLEKECYNKYIAFSEEKIKEHPKFFWSYVKSKKSPVRYQIKCHLMV